MGVYENFYADSVFGEANDFVRVAELAQGMGCRVEVLAFRNVSRALRTAADGFTSG